MISKIIHQLTHRQPSTNKYNFGHVLVVGGSPGMVGAPLLAAESALRVGAGLVTIASTQSVTNKLEKRIKEVMTLPLATDHKASVKTLLSFISERHVNVVAVGPGLLASPDLVRAFVARLKTPVVLDAGGLLAFSDHLTALHNIAAKNPAIVITPHTGEFKKLTNTALPSAANDIKKFTTNFATELNVTLVLKGHQTLVVGSNGDFYKNSTGNPGLATAGTGDVLTGVIAGLIAQGLSPKDAAIAGVYLHGLAGDIASKQKTQPGVIASDVINALPMAFKAAK